MPVSVELLHKRSIKWLERKQRWCERLFCESTSYWGPSNNIYKLPKKGLIEYFESGHHHRFISFKDQLIGFTRTEYIGKRSRSTLLLFQTLNRQYSQLGYLLLNRLQRELLFLFWLIINSFWIFKAKQNKKKETKPIKRKRKIFSTFLWTDEA